MGIVWHWVEAFCQAQVQLSTHPDLPTAISADEAVLTRLAQRWGADDPSIPWQETKIMLRDPGLISPSEVKLEAALGAKHSRMLVSAVRVVADPKSPPIVIHL